MDLTAISQAAQRTPDELTRRDVARALLTLPAERALAGLPALRRELVAAGVPLSALFWDRTEVLLRAIADRAATVGDIRAWLEATGTEPTQLVTGGFVWADEDERGPVATEMHARLIAHLEDLAASGVVDPDRLLAGHPAALEHYEQVQTDWLYAELPDGRQPIWAVTDEEDEEYFAAWDEAEAQALEELEQLLGEVGPRPRPDAALHAAAARLRDALTSAGPDHALLGEIAAFAPAEVPDDEELWLTLAAAVVTGGHVTPDSTSLDDEAIAAWLALDHVAWIGAVVGLARAGPGVFADADTLAEHVIAFEAELDQEPFDDPWDPEDDAPALAFGFLTVVRFWRLVGAVDEHDRLTDLGWWGLPESLRRAWQPEADDGA